MPKYKKYDYSQMQFVPINFKDQIIPGSFEYALCEIIDNRIDMSIFDGNFKNDFNGAPAFDPAILLKIVIFGYSKGIISSRKLDEACKNNIMFKAISANTEPHFTTIASFVSRMKNQIQIIFRNILMICSELNLIGGEMFAIDGCKIPSNASKEWSGSFEDLEKKKKKLEIFSEKILAKHKNEDNKSEKNYQRKEIIKERMQAEKILKKAKKIEEFLNTNKEKIGKRDREIKSNITDNESAKMKSSHGYIQGYNGIAMTDAKNQIIVCGEAFGSGQEGSLLTPMVEKTDTELSAVLQKEDSLKNKILLADTNYFSEDNLKFLNDKEINGIIPDPHFRKRDYRFKDQARFKPKKENPHFTKEYFKHDEVTNEYICPAGKRLTYIGYMKLNSNSGHKYQAKIKDCSKCKVQEKCLKRTKSKKRTLYISDKKNKINYSQKMKDKIDLPENRKLYSHRMGIVEPVFANITYCKKLNYFTLRGKEKVNIQWLLYCMVHNIGKIANYGNPYWMNN